MNHSPWPVDWQKKLEDLFDSTMVLHLLIALLFSRLNILLEDDCGATGFKLLADITPEEEFLYPITKEFTAGAESYRGTI